VGSEFEIPQTSDRGERCIATPAIAQGKLFIRTETKLYCITDCQKQLRLDWAVMSGSNLWQEGELT